MRDWLVQIKDVHFVEKPLRSLDKEQEVLAHEEIRHIF